MGNPEADRLGKSEPRPDAVFRMRKSIELKRSQVKFVAQVTHKQDSEDKSLMDAYANA